MYMNILGFKKKNEELTHWEYFITTSMVGMKWFFFFNNCLLIFYYFFLGHEYARDNLDFACHLENSNEESKV